VTATISAASGKHFWKLGKILLGNCVDWFTIPKLDQHYYFYIEVAEEVFLRGVDIGQEFFAGS
jgi:hypothetical protein